jgi:AraC-like DNA-binding protein
VTLTGPPRETSLSIRLLWPFARVLPGSSALVHTLALLGLGPGEFVNSDTRLPHRTVMALLTGLVERTGDRSIGLRAGASVERGDFAALEYAASSCANLREAILCVSRYMCLLNEAAEIQLSEQGDRALWRYRITDGVPQPAEANDFVVACAITFARMYAAAPESSEVPGALIEVHFTHKEATDAALYARFFGTDVKLGMPDNACIFARNSLDAPMDRANATFHVAFEAYAKELVERLRGQQSVAGRAREVILTQLRSGASGMSSIAHTMGMSVATLRRRLEAERTTHSEILDSVRYDLAKAYLLDLELSIREIAFLLGYSHAKAFYNAFKRWSDGSSPAEYRAQRARA